MDLFIAWDGDHIGQKVGRAALANDVEGVRRVSQDIEHGNKIWESWVNSVLGELVSYGGDEGRARVPADKLDELDRIRQQYASAVGSSVSVGVGVRLSEADRALLAAKTRGGDQIVLYTPEVEEELAKLQPQNHEEKLFDEYLKSEGGWGNAMLRRLAKDEQDGPQAPEPETTAKENKPNAGGGFTGAQGPQQGAPPAGPIAEGSEHSDGEKAMSALSEMSSPEGTHAAEDFEQELHDHAQESEDEDKQDQDAKDQKDQIKQQVVQILQQVKQAAPEMEQLRDQAPELYAAVVGVVQALLLTSHALVESDDESDSEKVVDQEGEDSPDDSAPVAKAEGGLPPVGLQAPPKLHNTVEGFMGGLKAIPKENTVARGKFVTQHMSHPPFVAALQAHPQGQKVHGMLMGFLNSKANAGPGGPTKIVAKSEGRKRNSECKHFPVKWGGVMRCVKCKRRHRESELMMKKSESATTRLVSAAFRKPDGTVVRTGSIHDTDHPDLADLTESDFENLDTGFVDQDGNFRTREEAAQIIGLKKSEGCKHFYGKSDRCLKCKAEKPSEDLQKVRLPEVKPAPVHHHLNLPVGSTKDGKVKVQHEDGKSTWVSVRAGQVLSNDGHPVSSRNPGGR